MTDIIPSAALESHIGILGKTGSGKSNLAKVIAEGLMAAGERVCAVDPTGTWWGLRLDAKGQKSSPFSPVIFGGDHADIAFNETHGAVLAEAIGTSADSAIIDTQQMTVGKRTRFFTDFAEALLRYNRGPLHLILDEAHLFAPQGKVNDPQSGQMVGATNNLVSLGRGRGLRIILISQRPAKLHKDSLTQVETLIAMRLIAPQDRAAVKDWIGEWADGGKGAEIIASLPSLARGEAWVWSPQIDYLKRTVFPLAATFDSGAPEANSATRALPPIDLAKVGEKMDTIRQEAMANDPKRLKARIAELERSQPVGYSMEEMAAKADAEYARGYIEATRDAGQRLGRMVLDFAAQFALATAETPAAASPSGKAPVFGTGTARSNRAAAATLPVRTAEPKLRTEGNDASDVAQAMSPSSAKLVDAIVAAYPAGMSLATAAKRAGLSNRSSAYRRYLKEAASSPRIAPRDDGKYAAVAAEAGLAMPNGIEDFKRSLPPSAARILGVLEAERDYVLSKDEIATRASISPTSSGLSSALRELMALGLAEQQDRGYILHHDFN